MVSLSDDYLRLLDDLGVLNTKQLVGSLTMAFRSTSVSEHAAIVAGILARAARTTLHKCEYLFLMDSLCKHGGPATIELFARHQLDRAFISKHFVLPDSASLKEAHRVLDTWTGPLFPKSLQGLGSCLSLKNSSAPRRQASNKLGTGRRAIGDVSTTTSQRSESQRLESHRTESHGLERLESWKTASPRQEGQWHASLKPEHAHSTSSSSSLSASHQRPSSSMIQGDAKRLKTTESPVLDSAQLSQLLRQITVASKSLHHRLYSMPRQCANCGLRFPDTVEGQTAHRTHMDGHFRRKARLRAVVGRSRRVLARDWLPAGDDWIAADFGQLSKASDASFNADKSSGELMAGLSAYFDGHKTTSSEEAKSQAKASTSADSLSCDEWSPHNTLCCVCQEPVEAKWDDDAEEWAFQHAVLHPTHHQPCHVHCL
jgi:hypothetical protein